MKLRHCIIIDHQSISESNISCLIDVTALFVFVFLKQLGPLKQGRIKGKTDVLTIYKSGSLKLLTQ